jgi:hypothetical protein
VVVEVHLREAVGGVRKLGGRVVEEVRAAVRSERLLEDIALLAAADVVRDREEATPAVEPLRVGDVEIEQLDVHRVRRLDRVHRVDAPLRVHRERAGAERLARVRVDPVTRPAGDVADVELPEERARAERRDHEVRPNRLAGCTVRRSERGRRLGPRERRSRRYRQVPREVEHDPRDVACSAHTHDRRLAQHGNAVVHLLDANDGRAARARQLTSRAELHRGEVQLRRTFVEVDARLVARERLGANAVAGCTGEPLRLRGERRGGR